MLTNNHCHEVFPWRSSHLLQLMDDPSRALCCPLEVHGPPMSSSIPGPSSPVSDSPTTDTLHTNTAHTHDDLCTVCACAQNLRVV